MANNWAIVIGINQYEHLSPERHLRFAVRDAEKMREFLCDHAGFPSENILLCTDNSQPVGRISTEPAHSHLRRLLQEHIQHATEADNFWFFFAGHGMVGGDRQDYLLPCDSYTADLKHTAIPITFVTECLRACRAKNIVLILDMCRSEGVDSNRDVGIGVGEQTIEIAKQQGIILIFSCNRGQFSYEIPELQQGAFTYTLLQGLRQHTILRQLDEYLNQKVPSINRKYGNPEQTPCISVTPGGKYDLPLLVGFTTEADITVLLNQATDAELKAETEEGFSKAKDFWWKVIENSQSKKQIAQAREAISRIDKKIDRMVDRQDNEQSTVDPLTQPQIIPGSPKVSVPRTPEITRTSVPTPQPMLSSTLQRPQPWTRQKFLKIAVPAGLGVIGTAIVGQFLGEQTKSQVNYSKLEGLLKAGQWQEADRETFDLLMEVANQTERASLTIQDIQKFHCEVLRQIDRLWIDSSEEKFGFSIQKKIYVEDCSGKPDGEKNQTHWECFGNSVGWRRDGKEILPSEAIFDTTAPRGHLPLFTIYCSGCWEDIFVTFVQKIARCKIQ